MSLQPASVDIETQQRLFSIVQADQYEKITLDDAVNMALDEIEDAPTPLQSRCKCGAGVAPAEVAEVDTPAEVSSDTAAEVEVSTVADVSTEAPPVRYQPSGKRTLTIRDIELTARAYSLRQDQGKSWNDIGAFLGLKTPSAKFRVKNWARKVGRPWPVVIK